MIDVAELATLIPFMTPEERAELDLLLTSPTKYNPLDYIDDPAGYGRDILGEHYTDDIVRVMESVRDYPITIAESANATGKTHGAARIVAWWYQTRKLIPGAYVQVYTAAAPPIENLRDLLWGQIYSLTNKHPHIFRDDKVRADLRIEYKNDPSQSFITGVTIPKQGTPKEREGSFSGKHAPYLLFVLDEADVIPEDVYKGIDSCLSGGKGKLLCMYNPRSDSGYVTKLKQQGANTIKLSAFDHPNVITGNDTLYDGAVTRNKTAHRIRQWTIPAELAENVTGYGRFNVPPFLVGYTGFNELNNEPYPPLLAGERVIINPDFAYMVLGIYPGVNKGSIYDVWLDKWDEYVASIRNDEAGWAVLNTITNGTYQDTRRIPMSRLPKNQLLVEVMRSNVTPFADYIPGGGSIVWSMDDGYAGEIDPQTMTFTADSHPRVIGFYQLRPNGDLVRFDEYCKVQEPKPEVQIEEALKRGYPRPDYVTIGPGSAALGGILDEMGFYKNRVMVEVEERIKLMRQWIAPDYKSHRRFLVHPRCKHFRHEMKNYKRDEKGRILKQYDHGPDEAGYLIWHGRNGF